MTKQDKSTDNRTKDNSKEGEEKKDTIIKSSIAPESSMMTQNYSQRKARDFQTASTVQTADLDTKTIEECTPVLFNIIDTIFKHGCPKATTKIGLIYLAKIINYYPEFTKKYL